MALPPCPQPGFYVAHGRWLDTEFGPGGLFKVGHTGSLGDRLRDDAYVTGFPPGHWAFVGTLETASKEEAARVEAAVLHCCRARRLGPRELVRAGGGELLALAEAAAARLGVPFARRDRPEYAPARAAAAPAPGGPERGGGGGGADAAESLPGNLRAALADLVLPAPPPEPALAPAPPPGPAGPDVDLLAELFGKVGIFGEEEAKGGGPAADPAEDAEPALGGALCAEPAGSEAAEAAVPAGPEADPVVEAGAEADPVVEAGAAAEDAELALGDALCAEPAAAALAPVVVEAREYQAEAAAACRAELAASRRAVLQMACRCGKTPVAFAVMRGYLAAGGTVLVLVPGLPLLRQTAQKLAAYEAGEAAGRRAGGAAPLRFLLVGSDPGAVPLAGRARPLAMTTDPAEIRAFLDAPPAGAPPGAPGAAPGAAPGRPGAVVVCTYQSSRLVVGPDAAARFALVVFDEAHRVCGGRAPRPFNHAVLALGGAGAAPAPSAPIAPAPHLLFMTATPAFEPLPLTMRDRGVFGGVAYRYHLRRGIDAGFVNDFRLEVVAAPVGPGAEAAQVLHAMGAVDTLLVFCRDTAHAERACAAVREAGALAGPGGGRPFECLVAHSRMAPAAARDALRRLGAPGARAALFSVRMLQEGVEVPSLSGVFFAAPRHSPRDIVQSVCRPLNRQPGKAPSVVFLPVLHDPALGPDAPANLKRFASVVPVVDALLAEDPRLYDHLLAGGDYPLDAAYCGGPGGGAPPAALRAPSARAALRRAVTRAARFNGSAAARPAERLMRADAVPWERAFAELARVVADCGRYPKTTDVFQVGEAQGSLHALYRHYADRYAAFTGYFARRHGAAGAGGAPAADAPAADAGGGGGGGGGGDPSALEPFQARALEALPGWIPYGVEGPYPWRETMATLEGWLEAHGGTPPMVNVNNGGYIGLDATPLERLSGNLTIVNQSDGKLRTSAAAQEELEAALVAVGKAGLVPTRGRHAADFAEDGGPLRGRVAPARLAALDAAVARLQAAEEAVAASASGGRPTLAPAKQADLDRICARFGLRWRKEREPDGALREGGPPSFIQEAYERFKAHVVAHGPTDPWVQEHFPGFPLKHRRMEKEGLARGLAPARRKPARRAEALAPSAPAPPAPSAPALPPAPLSSARPAQAPAARPPPPLTPAPRRPPPRQAAPAAA